MSYKGRANLSGASGFLRHLDYVALAVSCGLMVAQSGCRPVDSKKSGISSTAPTKKDDEIRCGKIYPSVQKVSLPILKNVIDYANGKKKGRQAIDQKIAERAAVMAKFVRVMLLNMMSDQTRPIDPVAFFATIVDFETADELTWATASNDKSKPDKIKKSNNCGDGYTCDGLMQVNIGLEKQNGKFSEDICRELGIWAAENGGGPDFCYSLYWWVLSEDGSKCARMTGKNDSKHKGNPCQTEGYQWTPATFGNGHRAYVQQVQAQWKSLVQLSGKGPWQLLYEGIGQEEAAKYRVTAFKGYEQCAMEFYQVASISEVVSRLRNKLFGSQGIRQAGGSVEAQEKSHDLKVLEPQGPQGEDAMSVPSNKSSTY